MTHSLPFVRLINLIAAIDDLPIPMEAYGRYRSQYDYILGQLMLGTANGRSLTVAELINCPHLGSQPTAHKRIKELLEFKFIAVTIGEDRRQKFLTVSDAGIEYLQRCSALMQEAGVQ